MPSTPSLQKGSLSVCMCVFICVHMYMCVCESTLHACMQVEVCGDQSTTLSILFQALFLRHHLLYNLFFSEYGIFSPLELIYQARLAGQ